MPHLDKTQMPSVFGVSGYSGAGTKSGEKDAEGRPKTVAKVVSGGSSLRWCRVRCGEARLGCRLGGVMRLFQSPGSCMSSLPLPQ
jgi:hypothetical protein